MHCLNFNGQRQKRHDVTNDVNVYFLIYVVVRYMKNMLPLASILFDYPKHVCNGICRIVDNDLLLP